MNPQVPLDKKELQEWLYSRYMEKEGMLGKFYQSGDWAEGIDEEGGGSRLVEQDVLRILILHAFFVLSTLTHVILFCKLLSLF